MPRQEKTVKPAGGGDFSTLLLGINAAKTAHTVADPWRLNCFAGVLLTAQTFVNSFSIEPAAGSEFIINGSGAPHDGTYNDLSGFAHFDVAAAGSQSALRVVEPYVHILNIAAVFNPAALSFNRIFRFDAGTHHCLLDGCLGVFDNDTGGVAEMFMVNMGGTAGAAGRVVNNLMVMTGSDATTQQGYRISADMAELSNNTFFQTAGPTFATQGLQYRDKTCDEMHNNLIIGASNNDIDISGGTVTNRSGNLTGDATGDVGFRNQLLADIIADSANSFFPKAGSLAVAGNGTDRSGVYTADAIGVPWVPFGLGGLFVPAAVAGMGSLVVPMLRDLTVPLLDSMV